MKTVSGMGRSPATIKLINEVEQCGICLLHYRHSPDSNTKLQFWLSRYITEFRMKCGVIREMIEGEPNFLKSIKMVSPSIYKLSIGNDRHVP